MPAPRQAVRIRRTYPSQVAERSVLPALSRYLSPPVASSLAPTQPDPVGRLVPNQQQTPAMNQLQQQLAALTAAQQTALSNMTAQSASFMEAQQAAANAQQQAPTNKKGPGKEYTGPYNDKGPLEVVPIRPKLADFISPWGAPRDGGERSHEGVDIGAPMGTAIRAPVGGTIEFGTDDLGGNVARLHMPDGTYLYFAHMSDFAGKDRKVKPGDIIGYVGMSGNAQGTTPHLHFGMYNNGQAINPTNFLEWVYQYARQQRRNKRRGHASDLTQTGDREAGT